MRKKGFTLVELVIVIVIVGILSIVAVPIYRGYLRRAIATEATTLLSTINTAEKVYYTEYTEYYITGETSFNTVLDVDSRANKYFRKFTIVLDDEGFKATTSGESGTAATGISATIISSAK